MTDTNWGGLAHNPKVKKARYWIGKSWAVLMVIVLPGWGTFTAGYWLGVRDERDRGTIEIARLQDVYGLQLRGLATQVVGAATAVNRAAETTASTSVQVEQAATEVQAAATTAQQAAQAVNQAASAGHSGRAGKHAAPSSTGPSTP